MNTTIPENFKPPMIKLDENKKSKINQILLDIGVFTNDTQLFCGSYDKLSEIEFTSNINFRTNFPIFGKKCNVKFQSLALFHLTTRVEGEIKESELAVLRKGAVVEGKRMPSAKVKFLDFDGKFTKLSVVIDEDT